VTNLDGIKVLVVDDEPFMRKTIKVVLRAVAHMVVTEAEDGDVALVMIERTRPDIVLCDINMPRMGGLRFVKLLREHLDPAMRDIPVIILTGHAEEPTVIAASHQRINGYLVKPVSPKQLSEQLRRVLATQPMKQGVESPGQNVIAPG
jgi:two-component system chemotaxis response regulator CheY